MTGLARAAVLALALWSGAVDAQPCDPCVLPDGGYRAVIPPGWDPGTRLKLLIFLHGWQNSAADILADADVTGPAAKAGYLLVAPDGIGKRWSFRGNPTGGRDDIGFVHRVLEDVRRRWPIDPRFVVAGGFSIGASLVWDLACHDAAGFTAFLPLSGGFWAPLPALCTAGPVNLRQSHGRTDTIFPLAGRAVGQRMLQGNIIDGFSRWREVNNCPAQPSRHFHDGDLDCDDWVGCGSGLALQLCLHPGGHMIEAHHIAAGLRWADRLH